VNCLCQGKQRKNQLAHQRESVHDRVKNGGKDQNRALHNSGNGGESGLLEGLSLLSSLLAGEV